MNPIPINQIPINPPRCSFKDFNSCNPTKFNGTEGATAMLQWFESMDSVFLNCDCPNELKVRYATSTLQKRALTWWNAEKRTLGEEATTALTWEQLKDAMTREFCPRNEIMKLEHEFWLLKQDSGENMAYNNRFHELSALVPEMVTPLSRGIEKYIGGLPMQIQDSVWSSKPASIAEAIRLSATLTDNHVKAGTLTRKGSKKEEKKSSTEPSKEVQAGPLIPFKKFNNKRKANHVNFAATQATPLQQVAHATQTNKKAYTGTAPLCPTCNFHHMPTFPCRVCSNYKRYGHFYTTCRLPKAPANQANIPRINAPNAPVVRSCYVCGDPGHFANTCALRVALTCFQVQALAVEASRQKRTSRLGRSQQKSIALAEPYLAGAEATALPRAVNEVSNSLVLALQQVVRTDGLIDGTIAIFDASDPTSFTIAYKNDYDQQLAASDSATNLERLHVHLHLFLGTYKEAKSVLQVWEFDQEHQRWLPVAELADPDDKGDRVYAHVWALNFRRPYVLVAVKTSNGIPIWQIAFKPNRNGSLSIEKVMPHCHDNEIFALLAFDAYYLYNSLF
ncbi:hypothetical protein E3N88_26997 [Mikania micrantha]|uniref:CCHC-type domain-containing protein n=1 Tax=Mikania micrantha TaxID=192012 RepID=A0A5N6MW98_9ASTR|nr:hypothetical protein E3N88_26997 [Mikania micrantha]